MNVKGINLVANEVFISRYFYISIAAIELSIFEQCILKKGGGVSFQKGVMIPEIVFLGTVPDTDPLINYPWNFSKKAQLTFYES